MGREGGWCGRSASLQGAAGVAIGREAAAGPIGQQPMVPILDELEDGPPGLQEQGPDEAVLPSGQRRDHLQRLTDEALGDEALGVVEGIGERSSSVMG